MTTFSLQLDQLGLANHAITVIFLMTINKFFWGVFVDFAD